MPAVPTCSGLSLDVVTRFEAYLAFGFFLQTEGNLSRVNDRLYDARARRGDEVARCYACRKSHMVRPLQMCYRWPYLATAVRRPTERSGHVVARNLAARIVV